MRFLVEVTGSAAINTCWYQRDSNSVALGQELGQRL